MHIEFQYTLCNISPVLKRTNNIDNNLKSYRDKSYIDANYPQIFRQTKKLKPQKFNLLQKTIKKSTFLKRKTKYYLPDFITHKYEYSDFIKINRKTSGTIYKGLFTRNHGIVNVLQYGYEFFINAHFAQLISKEYLLDRILKHIFNDIRINIKGRFNDEPLFFAKDELKKTFLKTLTNKKNIKSRTINNIAENFYISSPTVILTSEGEYFKEALDVSSQYLISSNGIDVYYKKFVMHSNNDKFSPRIFILHCNQNYDIDTFKGLRYFLLKLHSEKYALNTIIENLKNYETNPAKLNRYFKNCKQLYYQGLCTKSPYIKELLKNDIIIDPIKKKKIKESIKNLYKDKPFKKYTSLIK